MMVILAIISIIYSYMPQRDLHVATGSKCVAKVNDSNIFHVKIIIGTGKMYRSLATLSIPVHYSIIEEVDFNVSYIHRSTDEFCLGKGDKL